MIISKKNKMVLSCVWLLMFSLVTMIIPRGITVRAAEPKVTLSVSTLSYKWAQTGKKSFKVYFKNCDYCRIESGLFEVSRTKVSKSGTKVYVNVTKDTRNPNADRREVDIRIVPVVDDWGQKEQAKSLVIKQDGHGYSKFIMNSKSGTKGGYIPGQGLYSFTYTLGYVGYYKNSGKNRIFGKHSVDYEIVQTVGATVDYLNPYALLIKKGKKVVKSYKLDYDFIGGETFLHTGEGVTFTKVCYAPLKVSKKTKYKSYFAVSMVPEGGSGYEISLSSKLSKK